MTSPGSRPMKLGFFVREKMDERRAEKNKCLNDSLVTTAIILAALLDTDHLISQKRLYIIANSKL